MAEVKINITSVALLASKSSDPDGFIKNLKNNGDGTYTSYIDDTIFDLIVSRMLPNETFDQVIERAFTNHIKRTRKEYN